MSKIQDDSARGKINLPKIVFKTTPIKRIMLLSLPLIHIVVERRF